MIELLVGLILRFLSKLDSGAKEFIEPVLRRVGKVIEDSLFFRGLERFLDFFDGIKLRSFFLGNFLAPWKIVSLYFVFYSLLAIVSQVPIMDIRNWVFGILLFGLSTVLIAGSSYFFGKREYRTKASGHLGYGLILIGIVGLLVNYSWVGFPILKAGARVFYHNLGWMIFFNCFVIGSALLSVKAKNLGVIFALMGLGILLNFPSGFRTDLMVALAAVLIPAWKSGIISTKKIVGLGVLLVPGVFLVKALLIGSGDVSYIVSARAGFTYYTLENVLGQTSIWGQPRLALNLFLQLIGVKVIQIGSIAGEATVNLPRFYTSTFAGPLWISFGFLGVVVGSLIFGYLLGRSYGSKSPWGMAFYGILVGISLIWMETGPLQLYFLGTCLVLFLLILGKKV